MSFSVLPQSNFFRSKKAPKKSTTNQTLSDYAHEGSGEFSYLISPNVVSTVSS